MTCQPALLRMSRPQLKAQPLPCLKEEREQEILAQFLDLKFYEQWFHVPNGGARPSREDKAGKRFSVESQKMRRQGVKKGVPDNFIMRPVRGAPGVVVELKRVRGGTVSPEQKKWLATLQSFGWITHVAKGADDAIKFVREVYGI